MQSGQEKAILSIKDMLLYNNYPKNVEKYLLQ